MPRPRRPVGIAGCGAERCQQDFAPCATCRSDGRRSAIRRCLHHRNFGYLVHDTLFGMDREFRPQPEMVDTWQVSDDKLTYTFRLRDGLKFHDGQPVRAADAVASLKRWGQRNDSYGQRLLAAASAIEAVDDNQFRIVLKNRFPVLEALGTQRRDLAEKIQRRAFETCTCRSGNSSLVAPFVIRPVPSPARRSRCFGTLKSGSYDRGFLLGGEKLINQLVIPRRPFFALK